MPFTEAEFFEVFARYNAAIWPAQPLAYLLGLAATLALWRPGRVAGRIVLLTLALMWAVNGIGYHWGHFAAVNPAARLFGGVFVAEAVLLAVAALRAPVFTVRRDPRSAAGLALMGFAAVVYPLWGLAAGHAWPAMPAFGVAPCPTTLFTIGLLILGPWPSVRWLIAIPAAWAAVGGSAAVLLGVPQDLGLIAALVLVLAFALGRWRGMGFARHAGG